MGKSYSNIIDKKFNCIKYITKYPLMSLCIFRLALRCMYNLEENIASSEISCDNLRPQNSDLFDAMKKKRKYEIFDKSLKV